MSVRRGEWAQDVRDGVMNSEKLNVLPGSTLIRDGAAEPRPFRFVVPNFTIKLRLKHALWAAAEIPPAKGPTCRGSMTRWVGGSGRPCP